LERERVLIFDTSLRDGEQAPGCSMSADEKLLLARKLQRLGVDIIEAGFPIASSGDAEGVRRVATEVQGPIIAALARCVEKDIAVGWEAVSRSMRPRIHTFLATSDIHLAFKLKIGRDEALRQAATMVAYARSLCTDVEFSPEDATRSDVGFLCDVLQAAVESGATTLNIPDTVGYTTPTEYGELIRTIRRRVKGVENVIISVHCHNDLGLAVANSLAGVEAGARQIECTMNGIGERAGNASLEEVAMVLHVRGERYPVQTGIRHEEIHSTSQLLSKILGFETQPNKAIVGRNAFAHEAGIHQHGVLSNPLCYEIMTPETIGLPPDRIVLGKHSGRHALVFKYKELGYDLSGDELNTIYQEFTRLADRKKHIYEQDLLAMLKAERSSLHDAPPVHKPAVQGMSAS
jgi:2-isopropylmalate synthase